MKRCLSTPLKMIRATLIGLAEEIAMAEVADAIGASHLSPGPVLGTESSLKVCARRDVELENRVLTSPMGFHGHGGTPRAGFIRENPTWDDLGVLLF